jgi:acetolactate synthase-1/2/3 large subunit
MRPTTDDQIDVTGLVPDGYRLLASCFDAQHTVGGGLFALGDGIEELDRISSSGMCATDDLLYRCLWSGDGSPAELVVYDPNGVRRYQRLDDVSTPHDILAVDGNVLVVATTQNEVKCVRPDGRLAWRWQAPGEPDSWHLNSLARYGDEVVVCGFGQFLRRRGWDENGKPASGRVVSLDTGEPVLTGLHAPHNPWYDNGTWLVCDSAAGELLELSDADREVTRRLRLPGWPRGLAVTDSHLFVGVSPHRHASSSVDTAAVAVVDRAKWTVTGYVELPGREVYALALVPTALVAGARRGFEANHTRSHEQGQRQLFDRLGMRPRKLWAVGDPLSEQDRRATITLDGPPIDEVAAGSLATVRCLIRNTGSALLTPAPPYPVRVVHRWYDQNGDAVVTQTTRAALPRTLPPEVTVSVPVRARVPTEPGRYRLRITLEQEGSAPFDQTGDANALDIDVPVAAEATSCAALTRFGLYPSEVWAARAQPTVEDMVRTLLTRPAGGVHGVPLGMIEDRGMPAFVSAVAEALGCSAASIEHTVAEAIPDPGDSLLTGSEAVALGLLRAGVKVAFGYAGTSELAMCDSLARVGLLVNGRGDRESLFAAGGASRLRPGNGAAVLHGARGLTNALGALCDLRRNEIGTIAVVGLATTGSQPFLPPHGETDLVPSSGSFAKSWFEAGAVPTDPGDRREYIESFVAGLRDALTDAVRPPFGPTLFAMPQDVGEQPWLPLAELRDVADLPPVTVDADATRPAARLVTEASRPLVLIDDYALVHEGIRPALAEFCRRTGAPVLQVKYRRGAMLFERLNDLQVPTFAGWYDPADPAHQEMMAETDLLITVEDRNMYPRVIGELPPCRKIALTSKPSAVLKNRYLGADDALVHTDIVAALRELTAAVADRDAVRPWHSVAPGSHASAEPVPETAAAIRGGIARTIRDTADHHAARPVLLDDSQMFGGMLAEEYDLFPPKLRVFGGHGGFVGSGITCATGLAIGEPAAKVFCCLGDQGFTNSMQGLVAAVQEAAPVTFLVCNNGGAVSLRKQSRPSGWLDSGDGSYLDNADGMSYSTIAAALGVRSKRVDFSHWLDHDQIAMSLDNFRGALADAAGHAGPTLIELVLPSDPEFWSGVWITKGFEQARKPEPEAANA